jgi:hypothetical protein
LVLTGIEKLLAGEELPEFAVGARQSMPERVRIPSGVVSRVGGSAQTTLLLDRRGGSTKALNKKEPI